MGWAGRREECWSECLRPDPASSLPSLLGPFPPCSHTLSPPVPEPFLAAPPAPPGAAVELPVVLGEDKGKGVVVAAALGQGPEGYVYQVRPCCLRCAAA